MDRIRVKICGITRPEDALAAARCGVDAIGLVFYPDSSRFVEPGTAREIALALPPFVCKVGLFVDARPDFISSVLEKVPLDLLQFHGQESAVACRAYGRPYIKALKMRDKFDLTAAEREFPDACGLLVDTYVPGLAGGTGQSFDWRKLPGQRQLPLILAGGLHTENIEAAIRTAKPYAVDVSGGVESAPGIKDLRRMTDFMAALRREAYR